MAMPETGEQALQQWDAKQQFEAVHIGGPNVNQLQAWMRIFELLRALPQPPKGGTVSVAGRTSASLREGGWNAATLQQFDAICFSLQREKRAMAFPPQFFFVPPLPPPTSEVEEWASVRATVYQIIRNGFKLTLQAKRAAGAAPRLMRKP